MRKMNIHNFIEHVSLGHLGSVFNIVQTEKNITGRYIVLKDIDLTIDGMQVVEIAQEKENDRHYTVIVKGSFGVSHFYQYQDGEIANISLYRNVKTEVF